ncbi:MAG: hypothetical protein HKN57_01710 [Xanthomonadales bacterium]|nr:hypothetical protein [Gammaproteobacteria bacterium]MBT8052426.1 hypothetical protein [Gammaproteobacteria bacterium]NND55943.1 hypothetical protein [Xanthomonadales bacterium]NNK50528.1 hypothetical protein [Xanthomonadales bacterium]
MQAVIKNDNVEEARAQLRKSLQTSRWLRRLAILLAAAIAILLLAIKLKG